MSFDGERVTFQYKDYAHGNRKRVMKLSASEFVRRFLLHVLPRGFVRIRHYGILSNRHRHQEWLRFLRVIDQITPAGKHLHLIADNYATHKHAKVQRWLKRHPRFHVHFTPTSSSWLNMVERFFRDLTQNRLRRCVFHDVEKLIMAIGDNIARHNENPKPFIWTAKASDILEKVKRARRSLNIVQSV